MKKDSFTFSDKLKKSKTLPLSKRIPSRVGGEVKAKRTLFERAQRDLPFIIVAALALLLLPFLSRETGDIDTPSVVWGDGGDTYIEDFNKPESSEGEIALSSFRNPLDLIIRRGEQDSSAKDTIDTYGSGESSESDYSARSSYGSEEYSTSPATSRYGKTVKRTVRNAINRVPTAIGSLRAGSMASPGGASGVGHTMAVGSRARDAASKVQGPGVRPVALQPLTAAGKGRKLTGNDALYAEAARSIGAMNTPGAKQALMDAQLADVDGKPLGDSKESAAAAASRPGAAANLANNWAHKPITPWWWDIMKDRAQKRWMLWHYNWEKMASESLIKLTSGLASCLITGSDDFKVGKFLGDYRGDDNVLCVGEGGKEVFISFNDFIDRLKVSGGKDGSGSAVQQGDWYAMCEKAGGQADFKGASGYKSPWDVRLRCLGIRLSDIKNKYENKRSGICHLNEDPMSVDIIVQRNGKHKLNKVNNMGYYVVSKKTLNSSINDEVCKPNKNAENKPDGTYTCECVTYISKAKYGKNKIPKQDEKTQGQLSKVVVYKIGTHNLTNDDIYLSTGQREDLDSAIKDNAEHDNIVYLAQYNINQNGKYKGCYTEADLQETLKPIGKWRKSEYYTKRLNEVAVCRTDKFNRTEYEPVRIDRNESHPYVSYDKDDIKDMIDCRDTTIFFSAASAQHKFATTITNPGKYTTAFVVEYVQSAPYDGAYFKESKTVSDRTGYRVVRRIDFNEGSGYANHMYDIGNGKTTFIGDVEIGQTSDLKAMNDEAGKQVAQARPGLGWIYWTTSDTEGGVSEGSVIAKSDINSVFPKLNGRYAVCKYRWGCDKGNICANPESTDKYCFVRDGNGVKHYYEAVKIDDYPQFIFRGKGAEIAKMNLNVDEDSIQACDSDMCEYQANPKSYKVQGWNTIIPENKMTKVYIDKNCPVCDDRPEGNIGLVCIDPEREGEFCPCIKVDNPQSPADINPLYVRSDVRVVNPKEIKLPVTPICAKKAIALGNIYVRDVATGDAKEQVIPDADIVDMLLALPTEKQKQLCPFCNPVDNDGGDSSLDSRLISKAINFKNGCYDKYYGANNYNWSKIKNEVIDNAVSTGVTNFKITGHASGRVANCPEENCNELLAYDRAIHLYNNLLTVLEGEYNVILTDITDKRYFGNNQYPKPGTNGLPNYKDCENHWPLSRAVINTISSTSGKPTIRIELEGQGISEATTGRQSKNETKEERQANIQLGEDDRSAVISPINRLAN